MNIFYTGISSPYDEVPRMPQFFSENMDQELHFGVSGVVQLTSGKRAEKILLIYILYKYIKNSEIEDIILIDNKNRLHFKVKFNDITIEFLYDLNLPDIFKINTYYFISLVRIISYYFCI